MGSFALDRGFCEELAHTYWGKRPGIWKRPFGAPIVSPDELYRGIQAAFMEVQTGGRADIRLFADGRMLAGGSEIAAFLPLAPDLPAYGAGVTRLLGQRFGAVLKDIGSLAPGVWSRMRDATASLVAAIGLPRDTISTGAFVGNYPSTPYGIHFDEASVFSFPVCGHKRILVWPPDYFASRGVPRMGSSVFADAAAFAKDATVLEGEPGDMLYWPAGHWHIGVSEDDSLHASVNITFWFEQPTSEKLARLVAQLLRERGADADLPLSREPTPELPADLTAALELLGRGVADGSLQRMAQRDWSRRISAGGLDRGPGTRPAPGAGAGAGAARAVRRAARCPIIYQKQDGHLEVFASGESTTADPELRGLIDRLNAGEAVEVDGEAAALLAWLGSVAAVEPAPAPAQAP